MGLVKQYSIYPESDPWNATEHVAVFRVRELKNEKSWEKIVRINDPLIIEGMKFLLVRGGFSPKIIMRDLEGNLIFDKFVALRNNRGTEDRLSLSTEDISMEINFYPDFIREGKNFHTKTLEVRNPFYLLKVYQEDTPVFEGLVPFNGEAEAGGYKISFPEVRRWVEMELVGEPGIGFFFAASFVGLIGVFVRIIDPDERIYIILKGDKNGVDMTSYSYSKHFSGLIEDKRDELVSYIRERIQGVEGSGGQGFK